MSLPFVTRAARGPRAIAALTAAAAATITVGVAAAPAARADDPFPIPAVISYGVARDHLAVQYSVGWEAVTGPAASISDVQGLADSLHVGALAEYTGPGETGEGILIFTGDHDDIVTFQVTGATLASADNQSDQTWYICDGNGDSEATIAPGAAEDMPPANTTCASNDSYASLTPVPFTLAG